MFIVSWCLLIYPTHTTDQDHYLLFSRCLVICFDTFNWPRATAGSLTSPPWMSERWIWLSCLPSYDDRTTMIAWWLHLLTRCTFHYFIVFLINEDFTFSQGGVCASLPTHYDLDWAGQFQCAQGEGGLLPGDVDDDVDDIDGHEHLHQDDLFPPTRNLWKPTVTAAKWLAGEDGTQVSLPSFTFSFFPQLYTFTLFPQLYTFTLIPFSLSNSLLLAGVGEPAARGHEDSVWPSPERECLIEVKNHLQRRLNKPIMDISEPDFSLVVSFKYVLFYCQWWSHKILCKVKCTLPIKL